MSTNFNKPGKSIKSKPGGNAGAPKGPGKGPTQKKQGSGKSLSK